MYRRHIKKLIRKYLRIFGLRHWRLTRLYVGIPANIKKELFAHYPDADKGFYACIYPTSNQTFVMAVGRDIPENRMDNVIAHEISHILLHNLWEALENNRSAEARDQLEVACNRIADALTKEKAE